MSKVTIIAIGAGLLLVSAAAAAEMYRWVDAEGEVHYSDRPARGAEEVQIKTPDVGEPGVAPNPEAEAANAVRAEHCARARQRVIEYEQADGLIEEDEFGRRREIKGEERVQTIARARADVKSFCSGQPEVAAAPPAAETEAEEDEPATAGAETEAEEAEADEPAATEADAGY